MAWMVLDKQEIGAAASEPLGRGGRTGFWGRFRRWGDILFVLLAWASSWGIVLLGLKTLGEIL